MPKIRRGGYVFIARKSDHPPRHVHVWDLEQRQPMKGKASTKILELIEQLDAEGGL